MEIQIEVPPIVVEWLEILQEWMHRISEAWGDLTLPFSLWLSHATTRLAETVADTQNALFLVLAVLLCWPLLLTLVVAMTTASAWLFWLLTSLVLGILQVGYASYQYSMIACDIFGLSVLKTYSVVRRFVLYWLTWGGESHTKSRRREWRSKLEAAGNYENFLRIPIQNQTMRRRKSLHEIDAALPRSEIRRTKSFSLLQAASPLLVRSRSYDAESTGMPDSPRFEEPIDPIALEELGPMAAEMLTTTKARLKEARQAASDDEDNSQQASSALKHLLSGVLKRNHLKIDDFLITNARSVAESGQYGLSQPSRKLIYSYMDEVEKGLDWIAESPMPEASAAAEIHDRLLLVRKMKQNLGRTALMLSGGGAIAMYHLGTIRALIESNTYQDIPVISGTSGGSISAAMCAIKTPEELLEHVCVKTVSTDYMLTGQMKRDNIRWFPTVMDMGAYWFKNKLLVDSAYFRRTCEFYYSDITFEEAFERTGKHVCITVSASRASGDTAQRLLLNHISTPHVTLASAVAASCALPGVMAPTKLLAKNSNGELEPFEVDGVEWIDGSVQADLPFQRISTLFNVSNYIVCQTNFHVRPFLNKAYHPSTRSLHWRLFRTLEWDIRSRALKLSRLGLFPKVFGQDMSKVFKQKYHGNLTLVPRFTTMQTIGLKALVNPTVKDMEDYLKYGQLAAWPFLSVVRQMVRLEKALDACLTVLEERCKTIDPNTDLSNNDDLESIASGSAVLPGSRVRFGIGRERETERLRQKVHKLGDENDELKQEVERLREQLKGLGIEPVSDNQEKEGAGEAAADNEKAAEKENRTNGGEITLSEGDVFNRLRKQILTSEDLSSFGSL